MLARSVSRSSAVARRMATRTLATRTPIVGGNWCAPTTTVFPSPCNLLACDRGEEG